MSRDINRRRVLQGSAAVLAGATVPFPAMAAAPKLAVFDPRGIAPHIAFAMSRGLALRMPEWGGSFRTLHVPDMELHSPFISAGAATRPGVVIEAATSRRPPVFPAAPRLRLVWQFPPSGQSCGAPDRLNYPCSLRQLHDKLTVFLALPNGIA